MFKKKKEEEETIPHSGLDWRIIHAQVFNLKSVGVDVWQTCKSNTLKTQLPAELGGIAREVWFNCGHM